MINLSYGHISKEFIDFQRIDRVLHEVIGNVDYSSYTMPGGSIPLRDAIVKRFSYSLDKSYCCTSISTNLSVSICCELFSTTQRVVLFTPCFMNYYKRFSTSDTTKVLLYDYSLFLDDKLTYDDLKSGDVCILIIPNNPTGQMPSCEILKSNLEKIFKKGSSSIIDASWAFSVYDKEKDVDLRKLADLALKYNSVLLLGFTKLFGVTSIRCSGVIAAPEKISRFIEKHDQLAVSCGTIDEMLITKLIKGKAVLNWEAAKGRLQSQCREAIQFFKKSDLNIDIIKPDAGIFLYLHVQGLDNTLNVATVCKERGVIVYPSSLFEMQDNGFRICFGGEKEGLMKGLAIFTSVIQEELNIKH